MPMITAWRSCNRRTNDARHVSPGGNTQQRISKLKQSCRQIVADGRAVGQRVRKRSQQERIDYRLNRERGNSQDYDACQDRQSATDHKASLEHTQDLVLDISWGHKGTPMSCNLQARISS
jgi:hypothetical protein